MLRNWIGKIVCAGACAAASAVCANALGAEPDEPIGRESLHATLWMQTAPEYRASVLQVYRLA